MTRRHYFKELIMATSHLLFQCSNFRSLHRDHFQGVNYLVADKNIWGHTQKLNYWK